MPTLCLWRLERRITEKQALVPNLIYTLPNLILFLKVCAPAGFGRLIQNGLGGHASRGRVTAGCPEPGRQIRSGERREADPREPGRERGDRRRQSEREQHLATRLDVVPR